MREKLKVFFHPEQLEHNPVYEWAFGEKLAHPETTTRARNILEALQAEPTRYEIQNPTAFPLKLLRQVHDENLITLYRSAEKTLKDETFHPSVFPKRNKTVANPKDIHHAGFYCFDSGTPLSHTTWMAAAWSAACAVEATKFVETSANAGKTDVSYALCRPPGHHASRDLFGGYCYFNNAGLAAKRLSEFGKVFILDIDFHHGNGTQNLFYRDAKVFYASIHGDPKTFYPYYWGHSQEIGLGAGKNRNLNIPLPEGCDGQEYLKTLRQKVIRMIKKFNPQSLILSAGFDTYKDDPIGKFTLLTPDFYEIGIELGRLKLPTVIVQEGGYCTKSLGRNVDSLLSGFWEGFSIGR